MSAQSQSQAVQNYRKRLSDRGLRRYEVLGLAEDRHLVRALARRLADNDAEAARLRNEIVSHVGTPSPRKGGIYAALRRSPLVGVELDLDREVTAGRDIDL